MKYIALLRGINVGGNRKVPMVELKDEFKALGFSDVKTYINSGNVMFASDQKPDAAKVQSALKKRFGFDIDTLIIPGEKMQKIAAQIPGDWTNDKPNAEKSGQKSDVVFLFDDIDSPDVLDGIGYRPDVETMLYIDGAVLANVSRKNQSKYSLLRVVGTPLYRRMTVRNITTVQKLAEMLKAPM